MEKKNGNFSIDYECMGRRIRERRESGGMTREDFAEKLQVTPRFISDVELGKKGMSLPSLARAAEVLETSADYLAGISIDRTGEEKDIRRKYLEEDIIEVLRECSCDDLADMLDIAKVFSRSCRRKSENFSNDRIKP